MSIVNAMQIKLRVLFQLQEHYIHIHYTYTQTQLYCTDL